MKLAIGLAAVAAALLAAPAMAQSDAQISTSPVSSGGTVERAFEIGLGAGYSQGFGSTGGDTTSAGLPDIAHGGGEIRLDLGYRATNWLTVGIYGTGSKYTTGNLVPDGSDVWSASAGLQATFFSMPGAMLDPWISVGMGWRGHWVSKPTNTDSRQGLELARVTVGVDYKVTPEFSFGPYIGGSGTMFLDQKVGSQNEFQTVNGRSISLFVYGGIMGRFDLFGSTPTVALASN